MFSKLKGFHLTFCSHIDPPHLKEKGNAIIFQNCSKQLPQIGWLKTMNIYFFTALEARNPTCWHGHPSSEGSQGTFCSLPLPAFGDFRHPLTLAMLLSYLSPWSHCLLLSCLLESSTSNLLLSFSYEDTYRIQSLHI